MLLLVRSRKSGIWVFGDFTHRLSNVQKFFGCKDIVFLHTGHEITVALENIITEMLFRLSFALQLGHSNSIGSLLFFADLFLGFSTNIITP